MDVNGQKMQTDIKVVHGDQMGSRGGDEWKQGGSGGKLTSLGNVEARKQTTAPKKCTNQAIHWDANSVFLNKNAAHETRKNKAENNQQQRSATNGTQDNNNWKPANKTHSVKPTRKQCKRGSPTTRIWKYRASAKCEHIDNKVHEVMSKTIAENKASTQLYIQTQNAKKQVVKYTNNYAQHM